MPKQYSQQIKAAGPITKWRRGVSGGRQPLEEPRRLDAGGPASFQPRKAIDTAKPLPAKPIGRDADDLLQAYLKRRAAWHAVTELGATIEWAGWVFFAKKKSMSCRIFAELEEAGGPELWFLGMARDGLLSGEIPPGRATQASDLADAFYEAIVESCYDTRQLLNGLIDVEVIDIRIALKNCKNPVAAAALEYTLHRSLPTRKGA